MPSGEGKGVIFRDEERLLYSCHRLSPCTLHLLSGRIQEVETSRHRPFRVGSWDRLTWATWQAHRTLPVGWGLSSSTDMLGTCLHS